MRLALQVYFAAYKVNFDEASLEILKSQTHACDSAIVVQSFGKFLWTL